MKRYTVFAVVAICLVGFCLLLFLILPTSFDADAVAYEFSEVFGSYDISRVDAYFDLDTEITCRNETKSYREIRENVIRAFQDKKFSMHEGMSYGTITTDCLSPFTAFVLWKEDVSLELGPQMKIERVGNTDARIAAFVCDHPFCEYLFFGADESVVD